MQRAWLFLSYASSRILLKHWPVSCDKVMQGYAYILTHPGVPTVYAAHFFNWGLADQIRALTGVRRNQGLNSESSVNIVEARQR